jgi:sporulation integral membrane protein YlbJ
VNGSPFFFIFFAEVMNMKGFRRLTIYVLIGLATIGLVTQSQQATEAAISGLKLCGGVIIPALFPFFVLSSMIVSLGLAQALGNFLSPIMRPLFQVGSAGAGALTLGLIGGYPVGARTVRQLYEQGQCSKGEAQRLLAFCNNCGPAFILGVAGAGIFGSPPIGGLLLVGHILGACTVGILFRFYGKSAITSTAPPIPLKSTSLAEAFVQAVKSAQVSTLNVCSYVIIFSVFIHFLQQTVLFQLVQGFPNGGALAAGIVELSSGIGALQPEENFVTALLIAAFLLAFGGLSVQCQTLAMLEGSGLDIKPELLGKILHGICAAFWTWALLQLFPQGAETFASLVNQSHSRAVSWMPMAVTGGAWGIFLLLLLYFVRFGGRKKRRKPV